MALKWPWKRPQKHTTRPQSEANPPQRIILSLSARRLCTMGKGPFIYPCLGAHWPYYLFIANWQMYECPHGAYHTCCHWEHVSSAPVSIYHKSLKYCQTERVAWSLLPQRFWLFLLLSSIASSIEVFVVSFGLFRVSLSVWLYRTICVHIKMSLITFADKISNETLRMQMP